MVKCLEYFDEIDYPPQFPYRKLPGQFGLGTLSNAYTMQKRRVGGRARFLFDRWADPKGYEADLKAIWQEEPGKASLYYLYALWGILEYPPGDPPGVGPTELVEAGERLDPGNGWFRISRVAGLLKKTERDPESIDEAMEELEKASEMPRWDDYRADLWKMKSEEQPTPEDFPDQVASVITFASAGGVLFSDDVPGFIREWVRKSVADPGTDRLNETANRFDDLVRKWGRIECGYSGRQLQRLLVENGADELSLAASAKGDAAKVRRYDDLSAATKRAAGEEDSEDISMRMGNLERHMPESQRDHHLFKSLGRDEAVDVAPGRMAEYAMWERLTMRGVAGVLALLVAALALAPWYLAPRTAVLAVRMGDLLNSWDRVGVALAAAGIPVAVYLGSTRLLPVARAECIGEGRFQMMVCQALGVVLGGLFLGWGVTRLKLKTSGGALGFGRGFFTMDIVVGAILMVAMPLAGWIPGALMHYQLMHPGSDHRLAEYAFEALTLLAGMWLGFRAIRLCFAPAGRRLQAAVVARACAPAMGVTMTLAVVWIFALHAEERRWVKQMSFGSIHWAGTGLVSPGHLARAEAIREALVQMSKTD
jgi:hypothetical protein